MLPRFNNDVICDPYWAKYSHKRCIEHNAMVNNVFSCSDDRESVDSSIGGTVTEPLQ